MLNIKYIDLCCGIGGFRVGINRFMEKHKNYNFECVFSADIKSDAIKTYNLNFDETLEYTDIYDIKELPEFDLLCAGFPCQPFSSAGNKKGFEDNRGGMIFKIVYICKKYKPSTVLLENVSNLLSLENGKIIKVISIQSKKNPSKNATNKTTITTPLVPNGKALRAPSISSSPPKPLKINANIVAPTKSAKI